jgi:nicotinamide mononucleotide transporter
MSSLAAEVSSYYAALPWPELAAVILALAYLLLAIRQNIWCWFCAAISTAIYVILFIQARLYMESALNVFYFGMAIYGWSVWRDGNAGDDLPVAVWQAKTHAIALTVIIALSVLTGTLLDSLTDAAWPYVDSATTFAAIWATFMVARKVLENWWYWLVIDAVSVFIYWSRDLEATAVLFVFYVLLIPVGLKAWTRSYRRQQAAAQAA